MKYPVASVRIVRFGAFEADLRASRLRKNGLNVKLQDQPFQILVMLLEHAGDVVTREELRQRLWPTDTFTDFDHGLNNAINRLRQALCDSADKPRYVETLPRRGYRFISPVDVGAGLVPAQQGHSQGVPLPEPAGNGAPVAADAAAVGVVREPLRQRPWWFQLVAVLAMLLVGIAAGWFVWRRPSPPSARAAAARIESLAVLPLENLSGNKEQEYFVDGMTDELITDLATIPSLRVISRTSVMRYKGAVRPLAAIARDLKVDAVVEGTVLRSEDRVRITAQLIRVVPEQHLWAASYERNLQDVLALQGDVARAIVHEIRITLSVQEQARLASPQPSVTSEAHELYLKGLYFWNKRTEIGLRKSVEYFQQAVEKDPGYALAYAGLAQSYDVLGGYSILPSAEAFPKAEAAATEALSLDPELAEAHMSLGFATLVFDRNLAAAERELKQGVKLRPNDATAHEYYAQYFTMVGQAEEAIAEMRRSRELDPLSLDINAQLGVAYRDGRHYDQAVEQCRKTLELDPNFEMAHWCLGLGYVGKGMYPDAARELRTAVATGGCPCKLAALAYTYAVTGEKTRAQGILREMKSKAEQGYQLSYLIAEVYAGLRDYERAFEWLNKAYNQRDCQLISLKLDPLIDNLRSDPRLADLLHRVGLQ